MKVPSFDELDDDQLKELIQTSKKPVKKSKKIPLDKKRMRPHGGQKTRSRHESFGSGSCRFPALDFPAFRCTEFEECRKKSNTRNQTTKHA